MPATRNGFEVTMNCPNDRYVNDAQICQTVAANLARDRRQDQPGGRDQGHLLPEDPAPRHQLLHARLDADHRTTRTTRCIADGLPGRQAAPASSTWAPTAIPRWTS